MARSKLKVQNQLIKDNVKCSRMLIKSADKLPDIELFYNHQSEFKNEKFQKNQAQFTNNNQTSVFSNLNRNLNAKLNGNAIANSTAQKDQLKKTLMNKLNSKIEKQSNLDELKLELENNLKDCLTATLNANSKEKSKEITKDNEQKCQNLENLNVKATNLEDKTDKQELNDNCSDILSNLNNNFSSFNDNCNLDKFKNCETHHTSNDSNNSNLIHKLIKPNSPTKVKLKCAKSNSTVASSFDDNWLLNSATYDRSQHETDRKSDDNLSGQMAGHLLELCTKKYWLFKSVNWKRRYCLLEDNKLIIKDNQVSV